LFDNNIGIEILTLFVLDLLGRDTPAAKIYLQKISEDFKATRLVSNAYKGFILAVLVLVNVFFVYYTMLYAFGQGIAWQRTYLIGCIIQLILEVFIVESFECVWLHFVVPDLVHKDVLLATKIMSDSLEMFFTSSKPNTKYFLNAPMYLFVSSNVCIHFPTLIESIIVKSYYSHLPGQNTSRKWTSGESRPWYSFISLRSFTVFGTLLILSLKTFGTIPFSYQRVAIRVIQPAIVTGITYFVINFLAGNPVAILMAVAVVIVIGLVIYLRSHSRQMKETHMLGVIKPLEQYYKEDDNRARPAGVIDTRSARQPSLSNFSQKKLHQKEKKQKKTLVSVSEDDFECDSSTDDDDDDDDLSGSSSGDDNSSSEYSTTSESDSNNS
jgi:hypothetical protein